MLHFLLSFIWINVSLIPNYRDKSRLWTRPSSLLDSSFSTGSCYWVQLAPHLKQPSTTTDQHVCNVYLEGRDQNGWGHVSTHAELTWTSPSPFCGDLPTHPEQPVRGRHPERKCLTSRAAEIRPVHTACSEFQPPYIRIHYQRDGISIACEVLPEGYQGREDGGAQSGVI